MAVLDSEQSMFSDDDDDMPLASQSSRNGITRNGHVAANGAGSGKGRVLDADGDTPMSDVDDDDVPLVSIPPNICHSFHALTDTSFGPLTSPRWCARLIHPLPLNERAVLRSCQTRMTTTISPSLTCPHRQSTAAPPQLQNQAHENLQRRPTMQLVPMARSSQRTATLMTCL